MKSIRLWCVLFAVVASAAGIAQSQDKRSVVLALSLPNGATPQLRIADGETGSVEITNVGKFGFVPTIRDDRSIVLVDVLDMAPTPHERLDRVEVRLDGDAVQSKSNPQFGIRVVRVVTP